MNSAMLDTSIPILTEVLSPLSGDETPTKPAPDEAVTPPVIALPEKAHDPLCSAAEWEILERDISIRVLGQLQGRIDFVLEHRVKDCLAGVLQSAVADLTTEIRNGLQKTLEEVIKRAVVQEITHLQSIKK